MPRKVLKPNTITVDDYYSERFLHIETELRHQRELMKIGFDTMSKRFEAVDKKFELMREDMNRRFDAVDKRFTEMNSENNKRFDAVDKRFAEMNTENNKRFDAITSRMDRFMVWSFGMTITTSGIILAAIRYWR